MIAPNSEIRTVSLRFLRDGPTHNHLLSPLTDYLAVVGPYEAVTVHVPYEHRRLLRDLNALRYGAGRTRAPDAGRITPPDRRIIADNVSEILAAVPGLTSEMVTEPGCDGVLTHLCLIFSAAELSLLPFELATSPRGFPGEGSPLSVQSVGPVVMTRSIPGATGRKCQWSGEPNILFVAAQLPELSEAPVQAHMLALVRALRPWIGPAADIPGYSEHSQRAVEKYLKVLPRATLRQIEERCSKERFTHIHILAHTETIDDGDQHQFALALHGGDGGKELVSAERLQAALRLPMKRHASDAQLSHPLVVSLASCDSGNQSQVIFPVMSLAHALHASGVPLVVGSLFPLSKPGSAVMTESLYSGLLRGRDPRRVLYEMRHDLFRLDEQTHDWASIVAYASLPDDIDEQMQSIAFQASCAGINAGLDFGDRIVEADGTDAGQAVQLLRRIDAAVGALADDLPKSGAYVLEGQGVHASATKRRAQLLWKASLASSISMNNPELPKELRELSRERLVIARDYYGAAARSPRWARARPEAEVPYVHWVLTQALALTLALDRTLDAKRWMAAKVDADDCLDPRVDHALGGRDRQWTDAMWAHSSIAELYLLAHGAKNGTAPDGENPVEGAKRHMHSHRDMVRVRNKPGDLRSTVRQFERYTGWWFTANFAGETQAQDEIATRITRLARELIDLLNSTS